MSQQYLDLMRTAKKWDHVFKELSKIKQELETAYRLELQRQKNKNTVELVQAGFFLIDVGWLPKTALFNLLPSTE